MNLSCEAMADWIFQGNPRHYNLDASVAASRQQWWGTPRYRDRMAVGDRVLAAGRGAENPGIYYVATIVSQTYEHPVQPSDPAHFRWRTDIRFDYRIRPPLLRSELLEDVQLGSFRPFRGFQGSNVPVPPDVAAALAARAAPRLELLPPENGWARCQPIPQSACSRAGRLRIRARYVRLIVQPARSGMWLIARPACFRPRATQILTDRYILAHSVQPDPRLPHAHDAPKPVLDRRPQPSTPRHC